MGAPIIMDKQYREGPKGIRVQEYWRRRVRAPCGAAGGEGGSRTLERLITSARFPSECIQPLCHLSGLTRWIGATSSELLAGV
jgi:hypothetical protein